MRAAKRAKVAGHLGVGSRSGLLRWAHGDRRETGARGNRGQVFALIRHVRSVTTENGCSRELVAHAQRNLN